MYQLCTIALPVFARQFIHFTRQIRKLVGQEWQQVGQQCQWQQVGQDLEGDAKAAGTVI